MSSRPEPSRTARRHSAANIAILAIVIIAVVVSIGVGVAAGLVPAYRGARLDPIESLRYE